MTEFQLGDRVEIASGVLEGERATIAKDEDGEWYEEDEGDATVYIQFDRKDAHLGQEKGHAILSDRWEFVEKLTKIS